MCERVGRPLPCGIRIPARLRTLYPCFDAQMPSHLPKMRGIWAKMPCHLPASDSQSTGRRLSHLAADRAGRARRLVRAYGAARCDGRMPARLPLPPARRPGSLRAGFGAPAGRSATLSGRPSCERLRGRRASLTAASDRRLARSSGAPPPGLFSSAAWVLEHRSRTLWITFL